MELLEPPVCVLLKPSLAEPAADLLAVVSLVSWSVLVTSLKHWGGLNMVFNCLPGNLIGDGVSKV